MRLDREWPAWHPNQELSAQHLLGLEDFLIARAGLADEDACGVDWLDWRNNITVKWADTGLCVTVSRLRGVTPAGEPVYLQTKEILTCVLRLSNDGKAVDKELAAAIRHLHLDLFIHVNQRKDDKLDPDGKPPLKLVLGVVKVSQQEPPVKIYGSRHSLYLGRYRSDESHEMVHQPFTRRLGALEPRDDVWKKWVEPLRTRIEALARQAEHQAGSPNVGQSVAATEILRTAFDWPALPIPELARRLRFIKWLMSGQAGGRPSDIAAAMNPIPLEELTELTGPALPNRLADLLPAAIAIDVSSNPRAGPADLTPLLTATGLLADALAQFGVEFYAPVELLSIWALELNRLQSYGSDTVAGKALLDQFANEVRTRSDLRGRGQWLAAVIQLTGACIEGRTGQRFSPGQLAYFRGAPEVQATAATAGFSDCSVATEACRSMQTLYATEALTQRAGPLAFYYLASVAKDVPELVHGASKELVEYFDQFSGNRHASPIRPQSPTAHLASQNRVVEYLRTVQKGFAESGQPQILSPESWLDNRSARTSGAMSVHGRLASPLRIALVGPACSGKTTVIRQLCSGEGSTIAQKLGLTVNLGNTGVGGNDAHGTLRVRGELRPVTISEIAGPLGGAMAPPGGGGDGIVSRCGFDDSDNRSCKSECARRGSNHK